MNVSILATILSVLFIALIITVIFRRLHLPVILGYLLAGIITGPHALGLMPDMEDIKDLSEFGIVFLMFTIGLEFSLPKLLSLKKSILLVGVLQVPLTIVSIMIVGKFLGMSLMSTLVVGSIVSMSSTAIIGKQLHDQLELHSPFGFGVIGILLLQDLAVIPLVILIASLAQNSQFLLPYIFLWAFVKGILAIILIYAVGKWFLRPLFHLISKTRAIELFTLTVLLITLTAAWITNTLGLSYALGAFLAGLMLGETEFRHQIEIEIRPFRDILLGLFFISIGMLADLSYWHNVWPWIGLLLAALVLGKMLLIIVLSLLAGNNPYISLRTGITLAQGGEFGFAILAVAMADQVISPEYEQVILGALLLSITVAPILIRLNKPIAIWLLPKARHRANVSIKKEISKVTRKLKDHVIICGYGRVGQHIAKVLESANFSYVSLDINAALIKQAQLGGSPVIFGDATHPGMLDAAGLNRAKVLVITYNDMHSSKKTLSISRNHRPDLPILIRCKDQNELSELKEYGATKVIAEIFEESLTLSQELLQLLEAPKNKILELLQEARGRDYDLLRKVFTGSFSENSIEEPILHENLMPILLSKDAYAVKHKLGEFPFAEMGVEVIAVRRGKARYGKVQSLKPHKNIILHSKDILLIYGSAANIEEAERFLMKGP